MWGYLWKGFGSVDVLSKTFIVYIKIPIDFKY